MSLERVIITVMSGADDGKVLTFEKTPITLGRDVNDNVCLPFDSRTSRHHARITNEDGDFFIEDVGPTGEGSTNGTYINEKRSKINGKTLINSGDMILLGTVWIKFETK